MDSSNTVVYPPNKQFERELDFSKIPVIYNNLFFLDFNSEGNSIVGCSNVTGSLWEGNLLYFENEDEMFEMRYSKYYINSTTSDGLFLKNDLVLLAEDTGVLNVLKVNQDSMFESVNTFKHQELIPRIAIWENSNRALTCTGRDLNIWDVESIHRKPVNSFINYHGDYINSVDTLKTESNLFLSASRDRKCCIWDERNQIPASVLYRNEFGSLTSVSWNQKDSNYVTVGTEMGTVYLIDKRHPDDFMAALQCFDTSIHRILHNDGDFAVCGETDEVLVLRCQSNGLKDIYRQSAHKNVVRGLAWCNDTLYSCGFDKTVIKHKI